MMHSVQHAPHLSRVCCLANAKMAKQHILLQSAAAIAEGLITAETVMYGLQVHNSCSHCMHWTSACILKLSVPWAQSQR